MAPPIACPGCTRCQSTPPVDGGQDGVRVSPGQPRGATSGVAGFVGGRISRGFDLAGGAIDVTDGELRIRRRRCPRGHRRPKSGDCRLYGRPYAAPWLGGVLSGKATDQGSSVFVPDSPNLKGDDARVACRCRQPVCEAFSRCISQSLDPLVKTHNLNCVVCCVG